MLKRGMKISVCRRKVERIAFFQPRVCALWPKHRRMRKGMGIELQIGKWAAVVIMFCGLMGTGLFSLRAEAAQEEAEQEKTEQTVENPQENGNPGTAETSGQGIVLEAEERIEMKASPEKAAETLMTFQAGDLLFAVGEAEAGWYHVIYQDKEGYVEEEGLVIQEIDVEGLNAEMAANEEETKFVVEVVEKYRADARRSKIWGTVIIVLVAGIFGVGIFSAVRANKREDDEKSGGEKNDDAGNDGKRNDDAGNDGKKSDRGRHGSVKEKKRKQIEIEDLN